jgi:5-methylthioadenosine/S-adenosylhomocysteine deaminase
METVHGTNAVFEALVPTGLRAVVGKCLMDVGDDAPARLRQPMRDGLDESLALDARWRGAAHGRLRAALAPRFAISCSRELLEGAAALSADRGLIVHTHASEQRDEVDLVRARTGMDNVQYLASVGLASERLCAAHCVRVTDAEQQILAERSVKVLHCPGSNLKLGSGVAPVSEMRERGISVSLGADGAACNNALDMFQEMRLAATLQAMRRGPGALTARDAVWMATREGARAIGQAPDLGSLEPGKLADLIVVSAGGVHQRPAGDPYSLLVYACRASDVRATIIDGHVVWRDGSLSWGDPVEIAADADRARRTLRARAGV